MKRRGIRAPLACGLLLLAPAVRIGASGDDAPATATTTAAPTAAMASAATGRSIELRVETVANRDAAAPVSCEASQIVSTGTSVSFELWSALDEPSAPVKGRPRGVPKGRCGAGAWPAPDTGEIAGASPFVIVEVAAKPSWDSGAMDPGAGDAVVLALTLAARQKNGVSTNGTPVYGSTVTRKLTTRLEPGEEQVVPVALDERGRAALGVREVLLRVRAGWAGGAGAIDYGSLRIAEAAPGSEIRLDGGIAGRAAADGTLLLAVVPAGQHEVRLRGATGPVVSRTVQVMPGWAAAVLPVTAGNGSAAQPFLKAIDRNAEGFQEYRRARDGAVMVEIPAGEFPMGNLETEGAPLPHTVYVSTFLMDKLPLTVERYRRFAAATGRPLPPDPYWGVRDSDPVSFVRWDEGRAYCEWAGGRLPREAEREKATRGTDARLFPWGSDPPTPERAVFRRNWGQDGNDAAGIRPSGASPYGLLDTGGNMWEYCEDWWDADYFKSSPPRDPAGPRTGRARVVKGGSWDSRPTVLSASSRNFAYTGYREGDFGFRCAADLPR